MISTTRLEALGTEWEVEYDYYTGTNHVIHSASLEPNDDPELEITQIKSMNDQIPEDIVELIYNELYDNLSGLLWDKLQNPEEEY